MNFFQREFELICGSMSITSVCLLDILSSKDRNSEAACRSVAIDPHPNRASLIPVLDHAEFFAEQFSAQLEAEYCRFCLAARALSRSSRKNELAIGDQVQPE